MAETLISPGVFLQENDLSQITSGPVTAGAAIVGPTVTGPVNIPTLVTTYSQYKAVFGAPFVSGGAAYEYLTSMAALNYFEQGGTSLLVTRVTSGSYTPATASVNNLAGTPAFVLETLSVGTVMNNNGDATGSMTAGAFGSLPSGSSANVRWEVTSFDTGSGQFNIILRRGDDYQNNKTVLETWNGLSLDPNQSNYIAYVIGDQTQTVATDDLGNFYLQQTGSYQNNSRYVRVRTVNTPTPGYFNAYGQAQNQFTSSIPNVGSGSVNGAFGGAVGDIFGSFGVEPVNFFERIPNVNASGITPNTNIQGLRNSDYNTAINLLGNTDAYKFNIIYAPGLTYTNAPSQVTAVVNTAQTRGDSIAVVDMVAYGQSIPVLLSQVTAFDSSYAATYWPWVQVRSRETGKLNFIPASTIVPAAYEYNDRVAAEWWAPAGLNRGGLPTVVQPERKLTSNDRDRVYQGSVNPIATFPGVGTVIYGQKTLQQKPSALDRVNVRRLLIALKDYIGQVAETLVFEPNTQVTRNRFLSQVNPYLESVQQRQGLYAFQVVMDDSNNTPDVIDRNQLVGSIYLQPTKTAEFIQLDFNVLPTGATFGQ
jgi:hypothetical protein